MTKKQEFEMQSKIAKLSVFFESTLKCTMTEAFRYVQETGIEELMRSTPSKFASISLDTLKKAVIAYHSDGVLAMHKVLGIK